MEREYGGKRHPPADVSSPDDADRERLAAGDAEERSRGPIAECVVLPRNLAVTDIDRDEEQCERGGNNTRIESQ